MNRNVKKIIIAVFAFCLCFGFFQQTVAVQAAKALKITVSAKVAVGGDFLKGKSNLSITFKLNQSKKAVVKVINDEGKIVFEKNYDKCTANKKYIFKWDGKNTNGKYVKGGTYHIVVTSGSKKVESEEIEFLASSDFAGGNGSKKNPYQVANIDQFYAIAKHNGLYFVQTKDLDFSNQKFVPLFTSDNGFSGTYDGNGKTISNIDYTSTADYFGLFSCVAETGVVKNVTVKDSSFVGANYGAAITGCNYGSIIDCNVSDSTVTLSRDFSAAIAGANNGKITGCTSTNNIVTANNYYAGSIAGVSYGAIKGCNVSDDIISGFYAGGIVGTNKSTIDSCNVTGTTIHGSWYAGGIVGENGGVVKKCIVDVNSVIYATITGYAGGIAGDNHGAIASCTYYGELNEVGL